MMNITMITCKHDINKSLIVKISTISEYVKILHYGKDLNNDEDGYKMKYLIKEMWDQTKKDVGITEQKMSIDETMNNVTNVIDSSNYLDVIKESLVPPLEHFKKKTPVLEDNSKKLEILSPITLHQV